MATSALAIDTNQQNANYAPLQVHQLPHINNEQLVACNTLYCCPPIASKNLIWGWRTNRDRNRRYRVRLSAGADRLQLYLLGDIIGLEGEQFDWMHYEGQTRVLAWACLHEEFLQLVQDVWGCDWVVEDVDLSATTLPPAEQDRINVGFSVQQKNGGIAVAGDAVCSLKWVEKITVRSMEKINRKPEIDRGLFDVSAQLPWTIDSFEINRGERQSIVNGSIIRLDNSSLKECLPRVTVSVGSDTLLGELDGLRIHVIAVIRGADTGKKFETFSGGLSAMSIGNDELKEVSETVDVSTEQQVHKLAGDNVPITLQFEAGQLKITFADLQRIKPGYVFELDKKLEDRLITVNANGSPIARGQLVVVNDFVGVRITEIPTQ